MKTYTCFILFILFIVSPFVYAEDKPNVFSAKAQSQSEYNINIIKRINCSNRTQLYEFSNGMSLFIRNIPYSSSASIRLLVRKTGSINEQNFSGTGLSHLVEQLLMSGRTKTRSVKDIRQELGRLGAVERSFTDYEMSGFSLDCSCANLLAALDLLVDQICNPDFNQNDFDNTKTFLRYEFPLRMNNRDDIGHDLLLQTCYLIHPMRYPVIGYPSLFETVSLDNAVQFHKKRYSPNNFIFAVSGKLDPDQILKTFQKLFKDKDRRADIEIPLQYEPNQIAARFAAKELEGNTSDLYFAWPTVTSANREIYALKLLAAILVDGPGSRLNQKYKEEKQYLRAVESICLNPQNVQGIFTVHAAVHPEDAQSFRLALLDEVEQIKSVPVSSEELVRARKKVEADYLLKYETSGGLLDRKMRAWLLTGNPDFDDQFLRELKDVTPSAVQSVVRKFFRNERLSEVLICPFGMVPAAIDPVQKSNEEKFFTPAVSAYQLPKNELRILVKQIPNTGFVNISIFILSGTHFDNEENAGRAALLAKMLCSGTGSRDRADITRYFDSIGGKLKISSARNTISINAGVLKEDYPATMKLLAECLAKPNFTEAEFNKAKKDLLAEVRARKDRTIDETLEIFCSKLPESTPLHFLPEGTEHSVGKLNLNDIKEFAAGVLSANNFVVAVFGDIEKNQAVAEFEKSFGEMQVSQTFPKISYNRANIINESVDVHQKTQKTTATGLIAWPTVSVRDEKDFAALLIFQTFLTGQRNRNGALYRSLVRKGQVRWILSEQMVSPVPGYFFIYFETIPERLNSAVKSVLAEIKNIREIGISSEEFDLAKQELLAALPLKNQTLAQQAQQAALDDLYLNDYRKFDSLSAQVKDVKLEYMLEIVRRYTDRHNIIITTSDRQSR